MKKEDINLFQDKLLNWFDKNRRILPWREDPSPYKVWVSEIMLQQTRVDTVIPYYLRFIEEIPNVFALANISEEKLLKLWQGLGYYSRVRNMQKAAQIILEDFQGQIPSKEKELKTLPGIGPYTAGAIASIAFGEKAPAVDGNVLRIIARVTANSGDITKNAVKKEVEEIIRNILAEHRPGDFNQALMDLGATICIPRGEPKCGACPISTLCKGYNLGIAQTLPVKSPKKKKKQEDRTVFLLNFRGKIALRKRPSKGLLANLWEYPNIKGFVKEGEIQSLAKSHGLFAKSVRELEKAKHVFSHIQWNMKGYYVEVELLDSAKDLTWASKVEIADKYSIPTAFKAYTNALNKVDSDSCEAI